MFTLGPPLRAAAGDEYAALVQALFHFNDTAGTTIPVSSLGSPSVTNGGGASNQVAAAAAFYGSGGWRATAGPALAATPPSAPTAGQPYTVEFRFKFVVTASFNRFFGASNTGAGNLLYLDVSAGTLRLAKSGLTVATSGTVVTGVWNYVCIQFNPTGTSTTVDLNGARVLTTTSFGGISGVGCKVEINGSGGLGGADAQVDFDEFRWTHGVRRYPALAPVPTEPFPDA
jgi:hypothetical protein